MSRVFGNFRTSEVKEEKVEIQQPAKKNKKPNKAYEEYKKIMSDREERNNEKKNKGRVIGCFRDKKIQELKEFIEKKKKGAVLTVTIGDIFGDILKEKLKEIDSSQNIQEEV